LIKLAMKPTSPVLNCPKSARLGFFLVKPTNSNSNKVYCSLKILHIHRNRFTINWCQCREERREREEKYCQDLSQGKDGYVIRQC
jgi:hypothetical protein